MEIDLSETLRQGITRHQAGDLDAAESLYKQILDVAPGHADALHLAGLVAHQRGDNMRAVEMIARAIDTDAGVALYHANLGRVRKAMGDDSAAVDAFRAAVKLQPDSAPLHADLSSALLGAGDADAARARANLALELDPNSAAAHINLGLALQELHGPAHDDAVNAFRRAIDLAPELAGAYLGLGVALHETGQLAAAKQAYAEAIARNPAFVEAHCNLGNLARDDLDFDTAITHYRRALEIDPEQPVVWGNLAVALQEAGRIDDALQAYDRAVAIAPDDPDIRRNRGMALLTKGHYIEGWRDYEYRWRTARFRPLQRDRGAPLWDGSDPAGKRILVHAEQGLGDTLQFCRYLPMLARLGAEVIFECADSLKPLLSGMQGVDSIVAPGASAPPKLDAHIPLLSLPDRFATTLESVPADVPYLTAPVARRDKWAKIADGWAGRLKVGIAWRGSPDHPRDAVRSPGLSPFMALGELDRVTLVSLQKQGAAEELATVPGAAGIIDPTTDIEDFADSAALVGELDAVVSCDSAPLHLAGALGIRAYAVLPYVAEWRWGQAGETTPWYPAMTLVRQPQPGDWGSAFKAVIQQLNDTDPSP